MPLLVTYGINRFFRDVAHLEGPVGPKNWNYMLDQSLAFINVGASEAV